MDADEYIKDFLIAQSEYIENQIVKKGELLDFFMNMRKDNPSMAMDQIALLSADLDTLISKLLKIRHDSEFTNPFTQGVIDKMGNIKPIKTESLLEHFQNNYSLNKKDE